MMNAKDALRVVDVQLIALAPIECVADDNDGVDADAWTALDVAEVSTLEVSVHRCSAALRRELARVFANTRQVTEHMDDVLALPTFQPALNDLVAIGAAVELEKDLKLAKFYRWCTDVCDKLTEQGYWADFIDPCSGYPVRSARGASPYSEIDGLRTLLSYSTYSTGPCVVVSHPRWNTRCYPATMFTTAPVDVVRTLIVNHGPVDVDSDGNGDDAVGIAVSSSSSSTSSSE